jgi:glycosyltransferase involved in cell wall biosynthesis
MDRLYIIIPAYNEQDSITEVIMDWHAVIQKVGQGRLVILNDGSKDATLSVATKLKESLSMLEVIDKPNFGHGPTCRFGYQFALEHGADYVFQTDSDGQTRVEDFWPFWERRQEADIIIGFRASRGDGVSRWIVSKILRLVIFFVFGNYVKDANTPFRLMKAAWLKQNLSLVPVDFFLTNVLFSVLAVKNKAKVLWSPIKFAPRIKGKNSIKLSQIVPLGWRLIKDLARVRLKLTKKINI